MKFKSIVLLFLVILFSSFSLFAQQLQPNNDISPRSLQLTRVDFNSCFQVLNNTSNSELKLRVVDRSMIRENICTKGLNAYTSPVFYKETASFRDERLVLTKEGMKAKGIAQNVSINFAGRSADTFFLKVQINDQPEQLVRMKESDVAFVPAGFLDPNDKKTQAYFAMEINFHDSK